MKEKTASTKDGHDGHHKDGQHKGSHDGHHKGGHDGHHKGGHDGHHKGGHDGHHKGHDAHHKGHDAHHGHSSDHKHHLKGANLNASPVSSSHPIRPRARTLTHRDTAHSIVSSKGHDKDHKDHEKRSQASDGQQQIEVKYENTYKMFPDCRVHSGAIKQIINDVIKENIREKEYSPSLMASKSILLSDIIKEKVKGLSLKRFKIVSSVIIGEKRDQSMMVSSRCLWDQRFDNFITVTIQKDNLYIIGTVFVVYAE